MRSLSDRRRVAAEWALRGVALGAVVFALWRSSAATRGTTAVAVHAEWTAMPSATTRDSLAALRHAGVAVSWRGPAITPLAASAERASSPDGAVRVSLVGAGEVVLRDASGARDTVRDATSGAVLLLPSPAGAYDVRAGAARALLRPMPADAALPLLVVGRASWETKFVMAALEEAGWRAEARVSLAPGVDVRQPAPDAIATRGDAPLGARAAATSALDVRHFAAVVALDSTVATLGSGVTAFVRAGGGLVLAGDASDVPAVRAIAPGRAGARIPGGTLTFDASQPQRSLAARPVESLRADAVVLERRGAAVMSAARREGVGRVVQVAYDETWRWRMQGGDDAVAAHRAWWTRAVAAAVGTPAPAAFTSTNPEGAPLARLVDALGAPTERPASDAPRGLPGWLLASICVILLVEWGSRRLRGAR